MTLEILSALDAPLLFDITARAAFKPYPFIGAGVEACWVAQLQERAAGAASVVARREGRPVALAIVRPLEWESRVLRRRVWGLSDLVVDAAAGGEADVMAAVAGAAVRQAAEAGAETIHTKIAAENSVAAHALTRAGFLLMDTQIVFVAPLARWTAPSAVPSGIQIRLATPRDADALEALAQRSFAAHYGRFNADTRLFGGSAAAIYGAWARAGLAGYADRTLVADAGGRLVSFSMWKEPSAAERQLPARIGHYSIGAVDPEFGRRGLFSAVTAAGMQAFRDSADWVIGPTHVANVGVQRAYARLGWRAAGATHSFHAWL